MPCLNSLNLPVMSDCSLLIAIVCPLLFLAAATWLVLQSGMAIYLFPCMTLSSCQGHGYKSNGHTPDAYGSPPFALYWDKVCIYMPSKSYNKDNNNIWNYKTYILNLYNYYCVFAFIPDLERIGDFPLNYFKI